MIGNLQRRYNETSSEYMREQDREFMTDRDLPNLPRGAPAPGSLAVTIDGINIVEVTDWPVLRTLEWAQRLTATGNALNNRQQTIAERILQGDPATAWASWSTWVWIT